MYISKIYLENIRCFKKLTLELKQGSTPLLWTTLLGDNSTGKTTLLRCIAIGLCDESSAAGLLRESEEGYIRHSAPDGTIEITFCDNKGENKGTITTTIKKKGSDKFPYEHLSQEIEPPDFPLEEIFICAYGIGRGVSGTGDISGYSPISAVYNLFNYSEGLQNPELVIRRLGTGKKNQKKRDAIITILKSVLNLPPNSKIEIEPDGIKVEGGPWKKKMPLRDLADGYKSTFQWVTDFLGWAISYQSNKLFKMKTFEGIVLIDAIEEHLHPKWQRTIVSKLHEFANVQFIIATHSPLVASATVDYEDAVLIELEVDEENSVQKNLIKKEEVKGMKADEILRHKAFGLTATASPASISDIERYGELISKKRLGEVEKKEKEKLKEAINNKYVFGETQFERDVEKAVLETLKTMISSPTEMHFIETKKQLRKIFTDID